MPTEEERNRIRADAIRRHSLRLKRVEEEERREAAQRPRDEHGHHDSLLPRLVELSRGVARVMSHPEIQEFVQDFANDGTDAIFDRAIRGFENVTQRWRDNLTRRQRRNRGRGGNVS